MNKSSFVNVESEAKNQICLMANTSLLKKNNFESVKKAGRPNCLTDEKKENLLKAYFTYPYSVRQLADMFGVSRMTVWRAVNGG